MDTNNKSDDNNLNKPAGSTAEDVTPEKRSVSEVPPEKDPKLPTENNDGTQNEASNSDDKSQAKRIRTEEPSEEKPDVENLEAEYSSLFAILVPSDTTRSVVFVNRKKFVVGRNPFCDLSISQKIISNISCIISTDTSKNEYRIQQIGTSSVMLVNTMSDKRVYTGDILTFGKDIHFYFLPCSIKNNKLAVIDTGLNPDYSDVPFPASFDSLQYINPVYSNNNNNNRSSYPSSGNMSTSYDLLSMMSRPKTNNNNNSIIMMSKTLSNGKKLPMNSNEPPKLLTRNSSIDLPKLTKHTSIEKLKDKYNMNYDNNKKNEENNRDRDTLTLNHPPSLYKSKSGSPPKSLTKKLSNEGFYNNRNRPMDSFPPVMNLPSSLLDSTLFLSSNTPSNTNFNSLSSTSYHSNEPSANDDSQVNKAKLANDVSMFHSFSSSRLDSSDYHVTYMNEANVISSYQLYRCNYDRAVAAFEYANSTKSALPNSTSSPEGQPKDNLPQDSTMENKSTPTSGQTGTTEDKLVSKDRDDETILLNENSNPSFANFATPEPALETSSAPTTLDKKTESSNMIIERDPSPMPTTTVQRPIIRKSCSASTLSKTATKEDFVMDSEDTLDTHKVAKSPLDLADSLLAPTSISTSLLDMSDRRPKPTADTLLPDGAKAPDDGHTINSILQDIENKKKDESYDTMKAMLNTYLHTCYTINNPYVQLFLSNGACNSKEEMQKILKNHKIIYNHYLTLYNDYIKDLVNNLDVVNSDIKHKLYSSLEYINQFNFNHMLLKAEDNNTVLEDYLLPKPIHDYLFNTITYAIKRQELSASSSIVLPTPALSIRSASINNSVDGASAASSSASDMFMELDDDISNEEMFGDISDIESEKMFSSFSHTKKKDKKENEEAKTENKSNISYFVVQCIDNSATYSVQVLKLLAKEVKADVIVLSPTNCQIPSSISNDLSSNSLFSTVPTSLYTSFNELSRPNDDTDKKEKKVIRENNKRFMKQLNMDRPDMGSNISSDAMFNALGLPSLAEKFVSLNSMGNSRSSRPGVMKIQFGSDSSYSRLNSKINDVKSKQISIHEGDLCTIKDSSSSAKGRTGNISTVNLESAINNKDILKIIKIYHAIALVQVNSSSDNKSNFLFVPIQYLTKANIHSENVEQSEALHGFFTTLKDYLVMPSPTSDSYSSTSMSSMPIRSSYSSTPHCLSYFSYTPYQGSETKTKDVDMKSTEESIQQRKSSTEQFTTPSSAHPLFIIIQSAQEFFYYYHLYNAFNFKSLQGKVPIIVFFVYEQEKRIEDNNKSYDFDIPFMRLNMGKRSSSRPPVNTSNNSKDLFNIDTRSDTLLATISNELHPYTVVLPEPTKAEHKVRFETKLDKDRMGICKTKSMQSLLRFMLKKQVYTHSIDFKQFQTILLNIQQITSIVFQAISLHIQHYTPRYELLSTLIYQENNSCSDPYLAPYHLQYNVEPDPSLNLPEELLTYKHAVDNLIALKKLDECKMLYVCRHAFENSINNVLDLSKNVIQPFQPKFNQNFNDYEQQLIDQGVCISPANILTGFNDIGSLEQVKMKLKEQIVLPLVKPNLFAKSSLLKGCKGVLLFGPPGTGKTMLAKALAKESGSTFISISASTIGSKWYGESEHLTQAVFTLASKMAPSIIFVDEIDSILSQRGKGHENDATKKVKTEFMALWDGLLTSGNQRIVVVGCTNRPFDLDEAVLRRFSKRILIDLPNESEREKILRTILKNENLEKNFDFKAIASDNMTKEYSGNDLYSLCQAAIYIQIHSIAYKSFLNDDDTQKRESKTDKLETDDMENMKTKKEEVWGDENDDYIEKDEEDNDELRPITYNDFVLAAKEVGKSYDANNQVAIQNRQWQQQYGDFGNRESEQLPYFI